MAGLGVGKGWREDSRQQGQDSSINPLLWYNRKLPQDLGSCSHPHVQSHSEPRAQRAQHIQIRGHEP